MVVPNGTLFGDGVCARIKQELLTEFNLHTIVRLPNGVFAPYTCIPTNLLFFDRSGPTKEIWYYEQPLPEGRKNYTKTQPIQFEEFADCLKWWGKRKENERAWKVPAKKILDNNCNLDVKNPNAKDDFEHLPPEQLADDILKKEHRIAEIMQEIKRALGEALRWRNSWPLVGFFGEVLRVAIDGVPVDPSASYPIAGVYSFGRGLLSRAPLLGSETTYKVLHRLHADDFVLSRLKGWEGALAKIPSFDGWFLSPQFPTFRALTDQLDISYLDWYCNNPRYGMN